MPEGIKFVVDGGALLHRVLWLRNTTFIEIINQSINYLGNHYGKGSVFLWIRWEAFDKKITNINDDFWESWKFHLIYNLMNQRLLIDVLQNLNASETEVREAGLKLVIRMYGGKESDRLNKIRYNNYCSKAAKLMLQPERLPQLNVLHHSTFFVSIFKLLVEII